MSSCVGGMGTWEPGIQFSSRVRREESAGHWAGQQEQELLQIL